MNDLDYCPECKTPWKEEENIYEHFRKYQDKEKATISASQYGCTKEEPRYFGKDMTGIEIREKYDGVSYWRCEKCKSVFDRWTMKLIEKDNEFYNKKGK